MSLSRERRRDQSGVAAVEFALILVPLVLLLVGTMGFARAWNVHNTLDHAAREAARYGATIPLWQGADSRTAVRDRADTLLVAAGIDPADVTACIRLVPHEQPCLDDAATEARVQVVLTFGDYSVELVMLPSPSMDLEVTAVARYEGATP